MGYSLGPVLAKSVALPGGAQVVTLAVAATGAPFLALSAWVLTTRRDFSFMGGFLFAGMVIALIAGLGAVYLQVPALGLAVAVMVALLGLDYLRGRLARRAAGSPCHWTARTLTHVELKRAKSDAAVSRRPDKPHDGIGRQRAAR